MNLLLVYQHQQKIDNLVARMEGLGYGSEVQSDLAKYLCIASLGYLERSVHAIYSEYARVHSERKVARYFSQRMPMGANFNMTKLLETIDGFDTDWGDELRNHVDFDRYKSAIDSLRSNRNGIAHGADVGVSFVQAKEYCSSVKEVVELLKNQCTR